MKDFPTAVAAIDIGTSNISVIVAKPLPDNRFEVMGFAIRPNLGMSRGAIHSLDQVASSLKAAIADAEEKAEVRINSAVFSIPSTELHSANVSGHALINNREITALDLANAFERAKQSCLTSDMYLVNHVRLGVELDQQADWVKEPLGMAADEINAHYHMLLLPISTMQNFERIFKAAGVEADQVVLSTLASAESALMADERDMGVCLIDMGGATTKVAVYMEKRLVMSQTFAWGGEAVTRDIAAKFQITLEDAEQLKLKQGCVDREAIKPDQTVSMPSIAKGEPILRARADLANVIIARYEDMLEPIYHYLEQSGAINFLKRGIVLTGGASQIEGATKLVERVFGTNVHLYSHPTKVDVKDERLRAELHRVQYSTVSGLLLYVAEHLENEQMDVDLSPLVHGTVFKWFLNPWQWIKQKMQEWF